MTAPNRKPSPAGRPTAELCHLTGPARHSVIDWFSPSGRHQQSPAVTSGHQPSPAVTSCHQQSPAVTSGRQLSPAVTSGHQRSPAVISRHQPSPAVTSRHQLSPAVTSGRQLSPAVTSRHQRSPTVTSRHQRSSAVTRCHQRSPTVTSSHQSLTGKVCETEPDVSRPQVMPWGYWGSGGHAGPFGSPGVAWRRTVDNGIGGEMIVFVAIVCGRAAE